VVNHSAVVRHVLERTGHSLTPFRGWRLAMTYPVSLVEMVWSLTHPSQRPLMIPPSPRGVGR
jgi:hypothetical protein